METFKLKGLLYNVSELQVITDKFSKKDFTIEIEEMRGQYSNMHYITFELSNDNVSKLDGLEPKLNEVEVEFMMTGRKYNDKKTGVEKYFNSNKAINVTNLSQNVQSEPQTAIPVEEEIYNPISVASNENHFGGGEDPDNLPF